MLARKIQLLDPQVSTKNKNPDKNYLENLN